MNRIVLPAIAAAAAVGLSACGSSSGTPSTTTSAGANAKPATNGEQAKPAAQVLADAKSALFNAAAVHVTGSQSQAGKTQTLDVQFQGQDTAGTITTSGITLNIVKTAGKVYLKAPTKYWAALLGPTLAPKFANRWLVQDDAKAGNVSSITVQGLAASLNSTDSPLKPAVTTTTLDGQPAAVVTQQDGSQLLVAGTGTPVPLELVNKGAVPATLHFTGYGKNQTITAPPGAVTAQQAAKTPATAPPDDRAASAGPRRSAGPPTAPRSTPAQASCPRENHRLQP